MYAQIFDNLKEQLSVDELETLQSKTIHLGVFTEPYLTYMIDGQKTIESRFSKNRILPYEKITKDDIVIVKKSGGEVIAYFTIKDVLFFDLNTTPIAEIKAKYSSELYVDESFWESKSTSNYATLIFIDKIVKFKPFHIDKKGMQTWIKF